MGGYGGGVRSPPPMATGGRGFCWDWAKEGGGAEVGEPGPLQGRGTAGGDVVVGRGARGRAEIMRLVTRPLYGGPVAPPPRRGGQLIRELFMIFYKRKFSHMNTQCVAHVWAVGAVCGSGRSSKIEYLFFIFVKLGRVYICKV